jgi:phosphohistidine swiveling domain-containing protein
MTTSDVDRIEWMGAVSRRHSPLFLSYIVTGQGADLIERETGLPMGFRNMRRVGYVLQFDKAELTPASAYIRQSWERDGLGFFASYAARCLSSCERLLADVDRIVEAWRGGTKTPDAMRSALAEYAEAVSRHSAFIETMLLVQFELEAKLNQFVSDRLPDEPDRAASLAAALKIASQPTHEVLNIRGLLGIGEYVQATVPDWQSWPETDAASLVVRVADAHPEVWRHLVAYADEFCWMGRMYYVGEPTTPLSTVLRLQNTLRHDCGERLRLAHEQEEKQLQERQEAVVRLGDDDEARQLADIISTYMHLRSYRLDTYFIAHERAQPLFRALAERLGMRDVDDTAFLVEHEALAGAAAEADVRSLRQTAADRRGGFAFVCLDGQTTWTSVKSAGTRGQPLTQAEPLQGVTAWPGRAEGRVRLVATEDEMLAMEHGEILVTTMTLPALMLAVEKAAAIVTDEGGMLCHAAIVSREFNIPCVIGTGDATLRLSNGDSVLVNADDGLVTPAP